MRVALFSDVMGPVARVLSSVAIDVAESRDDFEICGFVTSNEHLGTPLRPDQRLRLRARSMVLSAGRRTDPVPAPFDMASLARERELPVLVVGDVNDPEFVDRVHRELAPDALIAMFFLQILGARLLGSLPTAVNYHDGLLPAYRGLGATAQSIYAGEAESGFTFHRMTPGIDEGPILAQGSVAVAGRSFNQVQAAKLAAAADALPDVIDMMINGDPGRPQTGPGRYFDHHAYERLFTITEPASLSADELQRRLRAAGSLTLRIDGRMEQVTGLERAARGTPMSFAANDQYLRATEIAGVPVAAVRLGRRLRRPRT